MHPLPWLLLVALLCAAPLTAHGQRALPETQSTDGGIARPPAPADGGTPAANPGVVQNRIQNEADLKSLVAKELTQTTSTDYVNHPEFGDRKTPEPQYSGPQSAVIPQPIAEALSLLAEIAVSRARRQGLQVLQGQFQSAVCDLSITEKKPGSTDARKGPSLLPATCTVITHTSLERLVSDPETVTVAITQDLLADAALALTRQPSETGLALSRQEAQELLRVAFQLVGRVTARGKPRFTVEDSWALASTLINGPLADRPDALGAGLMAARIRLKQGLSGGLAADLPLLVRKILEERQLPAEQYALALEIALEADAALLASRLQGFDDLQPLPQERLRAGVRLTTRLLTRVVEMDHLDTKKTQCSEDATCALTLRQLGLSGQLMTAAIDGSQPRMIIAGAELLRTQLDSDSKEDKARLHKASILLSSIAGYAATFTSVDPSNLQAVRASRKEILEGMIDASTDRSQRQGRLLVSVGAPVGFNARLLRGRDWQAPQLALPMGLALQLLPGGMDSPPGAWPGFHLMLTAIDLGQLVGYQPNVDLPGPTWDTVVTPGAQAALSFGTPHHSFLVGLDFRYARNPLAVSTPDAVVPREPLLNLFVAYYVPFFDFD